MSILADQITLTIHTFQPRVPTDAAADVGLTQRLASVDGEIADIVLRVLVHHALGPSLESFDGGVVPPLVHVAVLVVLSACRTPTSKVTASL